MRKLSDLKISAKNLEKIYHKAKKEQELKRLTQLIDPIVSGQFEKFAQLIEKISNSGNVDAGALAQSAENFSSVVNSSHIVLEAKLFALSEVRNELALALSKFSKTANQTIEKLIRSSVTEQHIGSGEFQQADVLKQQIVQSDYYTRLSMLNPSFSRQLNLVCLNEQDQIIKCFTHLKQNTKVQKNRFRSLMHELTPQLNQSLNLNYCTPESVQLLNQLIQNLNDLYIFTAVIWYIDESLSNCSGYSEAEGIINKKFILYFLIFILGVTFHPAIRSTMDNPSILPLVFDQTEINDILANISNKLASDNKIKSLIGSSVGYMLKSQNNVSGAELQVGRAKVLIVINIKQYRENLRDVNLLELNNYLRQEYNLDIESTELKIDHEAQTGVISITANLNN
ncbi:MAG: hypothetical protein OHK0017_06570 [Patescibacteria group bacterium]